MSDQEPLPPLPQPLQPIPPVAPAPQDPVVLSYAQAGAERPGILTVLGVLSIVFGGLGTLANLCGVFQSIAYMAMPRLTSAMVAAPTTGPAAMPPNPFASLPAAPLIVSALLDLASLALAIYLIVCGVIVLRSQVAGRKHHLRYAILKFIVAVPAAAAQAWSTYSMQSVYMASIPAPPSAPAGADTLVAFVGAAAIAGFWLAIAVAYPVAVLIVMHLKQVRHYYTQLTDVGRY